MSRCGLEVLVRIREECKRRNYFQKGNVRFILVRASVYPNRPVVRSCRSN